MGTKKNKQKASFLAKCTCAIAVVGCCLFAYAGITPRSGVDDADARITNAISEDPDSLLEAAKKQAIEASERAQKAESGKSVEKAKAVQYKNTRDSLNAADKAEQNAKKEARKQRQLSEKARADSMNAIAKMQRDSAKAAEKARIAEERAADKQAALEDKLRNDSLKEVKKQEELAQKARMDSIKRDRKEQLRNLSDRRRDSLRMVGDSTKMAIRDGGLIMEGLDTVSENLTKFQRDSIFREAKWEGMSSRMFKKWTKYFSTAYGKGIYDKLGGKEMRTVLDKLDTVRHDTKAHKFVKKELSSGEKRVYGKKVMHELTNEKNRLINENALRALDAYRHLKEDIKEHNAKATYYDSLNLVANRKPGEPIYDKLRKRSQQREKRIWKEANHFMRKYTFGDYTPDAGGTYGEMTMKKAFSDDSCFNSVRDQLHASFWKRFSFHTNSVEWLVGIPNIGIEFDLSGDPTSRYSVLLKGSWKPEMGSTRNSNTRINFSIWSTKVEVRKYWRVGGMQTTMKDRVWDNTDYSEDTARPDTIRPRLRDVYGFYNRLHRDKETDAEYRSDNLLKKVDAKDSAGNKIKKMDTVQIWTANILKRYWQPFRYNFISGRFQNKPKTTRVFYIGGLAGYERFQYVLGERGRQAKSSYICLTGGIVLQDLATFSNGASLDLDMGLGIGVQGWTYEKFRYDNEYDRYYLTGGTYGGKIRPFPTVHDLHVSLIYNLRPMHNKVHNLFMTEKFRKKLDELAANNVIEKDYKTQQWINREHLRNRGKADVALEKKEYLERQNNKRMKDSIKKANDSIQKAKQQFMIDNGLTTEAEYAAFMHQDSINNGLIDTTGKAMINTSEIERREPIQPEKPQYGVIDYIDIDEIFVKKGTSDARKPEARKNEDK